MTGADSAIAELETWFESAGLTNAARASLASRIEAVRTALNQSNARPNGNGAAHPQAATFAVTWYSTLLTSEQPDQLVKGLLIVGSLVVVFGESNCGKTFLLLDLCLAIARGIPWRGRRTQRGLVLYIAGEGAASVRSRVAAYRIAYPDLGALPFAIISGAIDLLNGDCVAALIATIHAAETDAGERIALVCVDTLARSMPAADENSSADMGALVAAADSIRTHTGATVAFVHHAGKDPAKGARGSSALRAATDTEILVEGQSGQRSLTISKQRDLVSGERLAFELVPVELGVDEDGQPISSCVVRAIESAQAKAQESPVQKKAMGKNQQLALAAIAEWARTHPAVDVIATEDLKELLVAQALRDRRRRGEAIQGLVDSGVLTPSIGGHRLNRGAL